MSVDPSKPNDPEIDQSRSIPRSRQGGEEVLEGEIIGKDVPLSRVRRTPPPASPKPPSSTRRLVLLAVVSVAALVCLAGSLTAYVLYDKASEPDRSTPEGVLEQYVDAKFNTRDDARARVFECKSASLAAVDQALDEIKALEGRFSTAVTVRPGSFDVSVHDNEADVLATLNVVIPEANGQRTTSRQVWRFRLRHEDSWLLCNAVKTS